MPARVARYSFFDRGLAVTRRAAQPVARYL